MMQLPLNLSFQPSFARADFLCSASNAAAVERVDRWPDWSEPALVMHGPGGCGKTHLAHVWCERAQATLIPGETLTATRLTRLLEEGAYRVAVDDADQAEERSLL